MSKTRNYINNEDLLEEIYKSIERDELTHTAVDMLMKLAQRTQRKLYYSCDDDKEHCLSEAYFDLAKRWRKFNPFNVRRAGFEVIEPGDSLKFYSVLDNRDSITRCKAIEYPEIYVDGEYLPMDSLNIDIASTKEGALKLGIADWRTIKKLKYPEIRVVIDRILTKKELEKFTEDEEDEEETEDLGESDIHLEMYTEPLKSRVKVIFKEDGAEYTKYIYKEQAVVKDPNPFSYFTSICINGFAKGYKELRPKKDKGRFISLDSGHGKEDGTDLYNY